MQVIRISECGKSRIRAIFDSGIRNLENLSELHQLFRNFLWTYPSSYSFLQRNRKVVVQSFERIYEEQFKSLGNQDLLSCLDRVSEFGYVMDGHPSQPEPEKE